MISLLRSIHEIWKNTPALNDVVPHDRVFTGRIPQTKLYNFPYVSILATQGVSTERTDKSRYSHGPVSFHIWVDEGQLEFAEDLAQAITDAYADQCWSLGTTAAVLDVQDGGEPLAHQLDLPTASVWEVVKLFTVFIERLRSDTASDCCVDQFTSVAEGSSSST